MKLTKAEFILLLLILLFLSVLGLIITIEATEIDLESLKRIVPEGECGGGTIPELEKSIWFCKEMRAGIY